MFGHIDGNNEYAFTQAGELSSSFRVPYSKDKDKEEDYSSYVPKILRKEDKDVDSKDSSQSLKSTENDEEDVIEENAEESIDILERFKKENTSNIAEKRKEEQEESKKEAENAAKTATSYGSMDVSSLTNSFRSMAASIGQGDRVTKEQLISLLQEMSTQGQNVEEENIQKEIAFVKNLIAKFDTISNGMGYITSFNGVNDIQDYKTVTPEQVTPPIDIRI